MNNYEIRTNKKKAAIIDVSKDLFKTKGFIKVSIKEIASKANVSQVSIYNYFGSKDALVGECITTLMMGIIDEARDILNSELNYTEKVTKALSLCSDELNNSLSEYFSKDALQDECLIKLINESINKEKFKLYEEYIEFGKKEGEISDTLSTNSILRFIEAITLANTSVDYSKIPECYFEDLKRLILYGIIGK